LDRISYRILGPFEVREGETEIELRGGQQRKLLAILLLHAGEAVSSDRLIDQLWHGEPPDTAVKALQGYVSSLRKQLGHEAVETVGAGYRLDVVPEDVDAGRFEQLLAEARSLERVPAATKLRAALALWRGPALADFAYDDFAQHEIDRLEELRLAAVERRIDLDLALGHHDDLVAELEALVRTHPLRERLRGHLMVALYRSGRQAEALDAYQDARSALRDELGLEPSEELQALQRAILDHNESVSAPPRVDFPAAPKSRSLRRPLIAMAVGLAVLGGAAAAIALTLGTGKAAAVVVPPNSVARIDDSGKRIESFVRVGRNPVAVAVGLGGVWVANAEDGTVTRLDPATGKFVDTIGAGGGDLNDIAVGFGLIWIANGNDGTITKIDPRLDQTAGQPLQLGGPTIAPDPVFYIATDSHYVWATRGSQLLRIDPTTGQVERRLNIGTPTGLAAGGGYVWVTTQSESLLRIDAGTAKQTDSIPLATSVFSPVVAGRSLWLIGYPEAQQISPTTLGKGSSVTLPGGMGGGPAALAWGNGDLWSVDFNGNLRRLEPGDGTAAPLHIGQYLSAVAAGGGATWVAVSAGD
jgi:DNA-binding SARP family transcriptional activator/streptogramin lyase